jgi:hypothetical protein
MGSDGMMHVILSAIIVTLLGWIMPWWLAGVLTIGLGIGKEVYDSTGKGCAEWKDIVCDVIGIIIGQYLIVTLGGQMFSVSPLSFADWGYIIVSTSLIMIIPTTLKVINCFFKNRNMFFVFIFI